MRLPVRGALAAAVALLTAVAPAAIPASASTAPVTEVIAGEHLRLVSVTSAAMASLAPGETASWDVGLSVTTAGEAEVEVALEVLDATPDAFEVTVSRCAQRWQEGACPGGAVPLDAPAPVTGARTAIDATNADDQPWYRMSVTFVGASPVATVSLRLLAVGQGEELIADPGPDPASPAPPTLPGTGASPWRGVATTVAAIAAGIALATLARRRRDAAEGGAG